MNVLTLGVLIEFWTRHPQAKTPLREWHKLARANTFTNFADVKAVYNTADWVKGFIVFDIGGNKYRLIVEPNFVGKRFNVEAVLTHDEYDNWRP